MVELAAVHQLVMMGMPNTTKRGKQRHGVNPLIDHISNRIIGPRLNDMWVGRNADKSNQGKVVSQ